MGKPVDQKSVIWGASAAEWMIQISKGLPLETAKMWTLSSRQQQDDASSSGTPEGKAREVPDSVAEKAAPERTASLEEVPLQIAEGEDIEDGADDLC